MIFATIAVALLAVAAYLLWRRFWFFRDPQRSPPAAAGVLSAADGTVVYVKKVAPGDDVVVIKLGVSAKVTDLMREDFDQPKLVIGVFMSPFDVHYNRAPIEGEIGFVRRYPALNGGGNLNMGVMHLRTLLGLEPRYEGSMHIVQNERAVTQIRGEYGGSALQCYVVQIGALTVNGIDSYFAPGARVARGATFGMIRIGSQVDLIVPWRESFDVQVKPGDRVTAGETILVR
ncbi:MAG TPA: phosphatidylserine decarboxylase [Usitatibacter sp.]|nr:phosphatidylserine decarboxylase [Usitatibacter sp.]